MVLTLPLPQHESYQLADAVQLLYRGRETQRFHCWPLNNKNTVGHHSHGVAMLYSLLRGVHGTYNGLMACLVHDLAEYDVGDVPAPTKRKTGIGKLVEAMESAILEPVGWEFPLCSEDQRALKLADCLDGMLFIARERCSGNRALDSAWYIYRDYVQSMGPFDAREQHIINNVCQKFEENLS